jgi:hypothetical protein
VIGCTERWGGTTRFADGSNSRLPEDHSGGPSIAITPRQRARHTGAESRARRGWFVRLAQATLFRLWATRMSLNLSAAVPQPTNQRGRVLGARDRFTQYNADAGRWLFKMHSELALGDAPATRLAAAVRNRSVAVRSPCAASRKSTLGPLEKSAQTRTRQPMFANQFALLIRRPRRIAGLDPNRVVRRRRQCFSRR